MIAEKHILPIQMFGGVDLRHNRRQVQPPHCLDLRNVRFPGPGTWAKRYGSSIVGGLSDTGAGYNAARWSTLLGTTRNEFFFGLNATPGHSLFSAGDRLFTFVDDYLLSHNEATDIWTQHAVAPQFQASVSVPRNHASTPTKESRDVVRTSDGLECVVGGKYGSSIFVTITDEVTGDSYYFTRTGSNLGRISCTKIGTTIMVFFTEGAAPKSLYLKTFTRSALTTTASNALSTPTATVINADLLGNSSTAKDWDVVEFDGTKCLMAYTKTGTGDVHYSYVDTAGARTSTGSIVTTNDPYAVQLCVNATQALWAVAYVEGTTHTLIARIYDSSMVAQTGATTIQAVGAAVGGITCCFRTSTEVALLWWYLSSSSSLERYGTINTAASVATYDFSYHALHGSRMWLVGDQLYCAFFSAFSYAGLFIVKIGDPSLAAPGSNVRVTVAHLLPGEAVPTTAHPDAHVVVNGSSEYLIPITALPTAGGEDTDYAVRLVKLKKASRANAVVLGNQAFLPGALTWRVDAMGAYEAGFLTPGPLSVTFTYAAGGGLSVSTSYQYRLFWEWINDRGELEQSAAGNFTATTGATDHSVILSIATLPFTNRTAKLGMREIGIGVYRLNPGASTYRRVSAQRFTADTGNNGYVLNDNSVARVSFTDADGTIDDRPPDYISDGEANNVAPPACLAGTVTNGRVFLSNFGHNPDLIWFSKQRIIDIPVSFSDDNTILVQGGNGPITALAPLGDALLVFRAGQTLIVGGDGPNNTGLSGGYSDARILSDEVGCENPASIVTGPGGTYFQAPSGGIYRIGFDEAVEFVGAPVQTKTSLAAISAAVLVQRDREIRFSINTGDGFTKMIVFHYDVGAWSLRDFPAQYGACLWRGTYTGLGGILGEVYKEVADQYHDENVAYSLVWESAWLRENPLIHGDRRFLRLLFAGTWRAAHKLRVKIAYNYTDTWVDNKVHTPVVSSTTDNYEVEVRPSRQVVQAIKVYLTDEANPTDLRDSLDLSELAVEVGIISGGPAKIASNKFAS